MMQRLMLMLSLMLVMAGSAAAQSTTGLANRATPKAVPELDGSMAAMAVSLIGGGFALVHGRRRRARN